MKPKLYTGLKIISILLLFTSIGFGQAKSKKKKSTDPNTVSIAYGKRIDSFAMKGYRFTLEIGFIKKRKFPMYFELSYFQRGHDIRGYYADTSGHFRIVSGFDEQTSAIDLRFKLNRYLAKNRQLDLSAKPFVSLGYQSYDYEPVIPNEFKIEEYEINLGLGLELNFGLKIVDKLYLFSAVDYILLRVGNKKRYVDNPLLPENHRTSYLPEFNLFDPYFNARVGFRILI